MRSAPFAAAAILALAAGSEAAAPRPPQGEIFVVGSDGNGRRNLTRTAAHESAPALGPDGRRIAYVRSGPRSAIWVMNADGTGQRRLTTGDDEELWPQWSPDGRRLVYMVWDYGGCYPGGTKCAVTDTWTIEADGTGQRKLIDGALAPQWSPDGSKLLFQRFESNVASSGVYVARTDGTGVEPVVRAALWDAEYVPPAWSPKGRRIAFGTNFGTAPTVRINVVNGDGSRMRPLAVGWNPAWSRDGSRIAFARRTGIWVVSSNGGRPRRVVPARLESHLGPSLAWSPTDERLAYFLHRRLYVTRADGRAKKLVATGANCCFRIFVAPPAWSRDGRRLYYAG